MEIRHLRYFLAVAEELNFSRAAARLNMAQPPLSQQIMQLESHLGVQLFERETRPIRLTVAGLTLLEQARPLIKRFDQLELKLQLMGSGDTGSLAIGFVSSAMYELLPDVLKNFRARYPRVHVDLTELTGLEQEEALHEHSIDVAFIRGTSSDPDFVGEVVVEEPLVVAVPSQWELAKKDSVALKSLSKEPFIVFPTKPDPSFANFIKSLCRQAGFEPRVMQEANELQTAVSLVASGIGISLMPASVQMLQRRGVSYVTLKEPAPRTVISVLHRKNDPGPSLRNFLSVLAERV
ncbi:MAG: LysR family transcriptional regulator [Cyanobacteria bacterium SZAS LIN-3]|nr:LysR family transcriptional regulator [Cyanobacteria bacterium SZAS LIN-3]